MGSQPPGFTCGPFVLNCLGLAPPVLAWAAPLCFENLSVSSSLLCCSLPLLPAAPPSTRAQLSIKVGLYELCDPSGTLLTASRSRSMIVSSSSKCRSLISSFFICVSTRRATRDLIFLSSTAARC